MKRAIVHLDADAFFASVEQASDPRLRGKPVAVGGEKRGIIASASYEARKFGVYTPMPTVRARRLCPRLIILPGDFEKYERFSRWMFSYAHDFTPDVEICSVDEGYFDLTGARRSPVQIAETIRRAIHQSLKISVSEGIAVNKLVSQIASKLNKPAAFFFVPSGEETAFLHPLVNRWLPGVGPLLANRLNAAGLVHIGQIAQTPLDFLGCLVGKGAPQMRDFANGKDDRPVVAAPPEARSYSKQETFEEDTTREEFVEAVLRRMADLLMTAVRQDGKGIRTVTVKIRYNDMSEDQRSESLQEPTDLETDIYPRLRPMLQQAWKRRVSLRMVSLRFSNIYSSFLRSELPLGEETQRYEARHRLARAVQELRSEYGPRAVMRGHDLLLSRACRAGSRRTRTGKTLGSLPVPCRIALPRKATWIPLQVHSHYSFLDSTLSPEAVVELATRYELPAVALTDHENLHGAIAFFQAAKAAGIKPILGTEIRLRSSLLHLYVENARGYRNLCRILTHISHDSGKMQAGGHLPACLDGVQTDGLIATATDPLLARSFPGRFYLEVENGKAFGRMGAPNDLPTVASFPIRYAERGDRWKFAVVQSIRTRTLLRQEHPDKRLNSEHHFVSPAEAMERFRGCEELPARTGEIAERCCFDFEPGTPQFPAFVPPDGSTSSLFLRKQVFEGMQRKYPGRLECIRPQVEEELGIVREVGYEEYFLVVWDILRECRRRGIEWITRGSAADSLVCYCLGISDVCPIRFDLYFRRFLNRDRMKLNKLPDIDVDFAHDCKDDVIDLVFEKYGAEHAAVMGGFSTYQARSAFADVAKVLGVSDHQVRRFTEHMPHTRVRDMEAAMALARECRDLPLEEDPWRATLKMAQFLDGFPRHAKMHPCGVVLSRSPMMDLVPCFISNKGYPATHFDMDAVEAIGLMKMDILGQGGLAVMRDVRQSLAERGIEANLGSLQPWEDPEVWEMIARGGARAVHHIESPAMISLCRMCNVRDVDGLIAIVSVIRPGAANEHKKIHFTRRYQGLEPVMYPHPSLEACLKSTFGMVVYEEHILQICDLFAGLSAGRSDVLRRALSKQKTGVIEEISREFSALARARGHSEREIAAVWNLVAGFTGYAFCKAHSTAYGVEAYQGAWLKRYYPAEFMAAVLSNGKGFYQPMVYILECHRLGIPLLPPWINAPGPAFRVEAGKIRVPATRVKGLGEKIKNRLVEERSHGEFKSLRDFYRRVRPSPSEMLALLRTGAFDGFGASPTALFWEMEFLCQSIGEDAPAQGWLLPPRSERRLPPVDLTEPSRLDRLRWEAELLDFPVSGHPLELYPGIAWNTYCPLARLQDHIGETVTTCGLIVEDRVHHQVTGEPMKFLTIADRSDMVETELFAGSYKRHGLATVRYPVLEVTATVEPYENGRGHSLRVHRAGKPRMEDSSSSVPRTVAF